MAEYIDKNATVGILEAMSRNADCECIKKRLEKAAKRVSAIPAADVAPVRYGRWIDNHCTACGMMPMGDEMWKNYDCEPPLFERFMDYCPSCGAKMQE